NFQYIESELDRRGIKYCKITGQTPKQKRFEMVDSFNNDDTPVFLISLKAGGTGLNITGADTVIHYDPWWNTAVESQATDRVHRMGQTKNVFVYKLICEKTIEEQIVKLQEQKRKLSESLLDSDSIKSSSLTKDEVLSLL
ncbi:MAG: DEAD/DEAH box helicase, partial [Coprobacillaceae bacterium]